MSSSEHLVAELEFSWRPFTVGREHLSFDQHRVARLARSLCSHWGPAVYKWQGLLSAGPQSGKTALLIGETADLRQRIKQYVSGPQVRGNRLWRETFLTLGEVRLYTLEVRSMAVDGVKLELPNLMASTNMRLVVEQLLVMRAVAARDASVWIVNARQ